MKIEQLIRELEDARGRLDMVVAEYETIRDMAVPADVKQALREIDEEWGDTIAAAKESYAKAEAAAKQAVAENGKTAKGQFLQVVYTKPRVSWDAKALDGFAVNHPELFAFRKEGKAGASVRVIK